jgi:hypothetical protein
LVESNTRNQFSPQILVRRPALRKIGDERLTRVPRDLDLTPYRDEEDVAELRKIIATR